MAGWHSLSGYLWFRPGGTFAKLKSRKRQWYMFEEKKCQLLYYRTQDEARIKEPLGHIDICGAAISLNLDQNNQFVVTTEGKEYIFTADNHESMMIWLLGLQAKRDAFSNKKSDGSSKDKKKQSKSKDLDDAITRRKSEPIFKRWASFRAPSPDSLRSNLPPKFDQRRRQRLLEHLGQTMDSSFNWFPDELDEINKGTERVGMDKMQVTMTRSLDSALPRGAYLPRQDTESSCTSTESLQTDDVFLNEEILSSSPLAPKEKCRLLRKMQSDITDAKVSGLLGGQEDRQGSGSTSRLSGSSDSAIGERSESELLSRMNEMEQELIVTKCELAKVLNRESAYKTIIHKRDSLILELDEKVCDVQSPGADKRRLADRKSPEQVRILQNQNRFLNEEVKRLARLRHSEMELFSNQDKRLHVLDAEIDRWKRDYVSLLQSTICIPTGDLMDGMQVNLFGGNRHRERIQSLLDEARESNPGLPTIDRLAKSDMHIDSYGFKHTHDNEGMLLHYICQQLNHYYTAQLASYEVHQQKWRDILVKGKTTLVKACEDRESKKELKWLCRWGVPPQYRSQVWRQLVHHQVKDILDEKGSHYYSNLCNVAFDSQFAGRYRKQISLDLLRTMPNNINFNNQNAEGILKMQEVLQAFCIHNPAVGYCQGMNFIVGMALLFLDAEDAFWTLVGITEKYFASSYFDNNLSGAQADQEVLKELIRDRLPALSRHLEDHDIEISTITLNWFLAIFFDAVPFETLIRIWDSFLLEGPKVLFRFALAILKIHESSILQKKDTISIMRHLKSCPRLTFDVEGLVRTAFDKLKPFPRRQDISARQIVYIKTLKEKLRKKELQRRAFVDREQMFRELELTASHAQVIECATSYQEACSEPVISCGALCGEGYLWLCHGVQNNGRVCLVNCGEGLMSDLGIELDSRIMCVASLNEDILLLGTLSGDLHAFNTKTRQQLWHVGLHDTVLSICCHLEEQSNRVFAALADGTVAILEDVNIYEPREDPFYIPVGRSPVTSVILIEQQLWAASGNTVHIFYAETLDPMDSFMVSTNPFDHILTLSFGEHGVWIAVKGSSVIELWDRKLLTCKMLYDTKGNKYPSLRRDDESTLNMARITSVLPFNSAIWIGTGDGNLIMYDVMERPCSAQAVDLSPASNSQPNSPYMKHKKHSHKPNTVDNIEEKVHELYFQRLQEQLAAARAGQQGTTDPSEPPVSVSMTIGSSANSSAVSSKAGTPVSEGVTMETSLIEDSKRTRSEGRVKKDAGKVSNRKTKDQSSTKSAKEKKKRRPKREQAVDMKEQQTGLQDGVSRKNISEDHRSGKVRHKASEVSSKVGTTHRGTSAHSAKISEQEISQNDVEHVETGTRTTGFIDREEEKTGLSIMEADHTPIRKKKPREKSPGDAREGAEAVPKQRSKQRNTHERSDGEPLKTKKESTVVNIKKSADLCEVAKIDRALSRDEAQEDKFSLVKAIHEREISLQNKMFGKAGDGDMPRKVDINPITKPTGAACHKALKTGGMSEGRSRRQQIETLDRRHSLEEQGDSISLSKGRQHRRVKSLDFTENLPSAIDASDSALFPICDRRISEREGWDEQTYVTSNVDTKKERHSSTWNKAFSEELSKDALDRELPGWMLKKQRLASKYLRRTCSEDMNRFVMDDPSDGMPPKWTHRRTSSLPKTMYRNIARDNGVPQERKLSPKVREKKANKKLSKKQRSWDEEHPRKSEALLRMKQLHFSEANISDLQYEDDPLVYTPWLMNGDLSVSEMVLFRKEQSVMDSDSFDSEDKFSQSMEVLNKSDSENTYDILDSKVKHGSGGSSLGSNSSLYDSCTEGMDRNGADASKVDSQEKTEHRISGVNGLNLPPFFLKGDEKGGVLPPVESLVTAEPEVASQEVYTQLLSPISETTEDPSAVNGSLADEESDGSSGAAGYSHTAVHVGQSHTNTLSSSEANIPPRLSPISEGTEANSLGDLSDIGTRSRSNTVGKDSDLALRNLNNWGSVPCVPVVINVEERLSPKDKSKSCDISKVGKGKSRKLKRTDYNTISGDLILPAHDQWSSCDDIPADIELPVGQEGHLKPRHKQSKTASNTSINSLSEVPYSFELSLQAKIKIADKPIRCLVKTSLLGEPMIISCAGCFDDDEAVLKWIKEPNEKLWTNEPIFELCPITNLPKAPSYMRTRFSSASSLLSYDSCESLKSLWLPRKQSSQSQKSVGSDGKESCLSQSVGSDTVSLEMRGTVT